MNEYRISNKGTTRLFENKALERLTRTPFLVPVVFYYLAAGFLIAYGAIYTPLALWKLSYLFPLGMITFTFVEYLIHRFAFHFHAETEKQEQIKYNIHGVHHEFPRDKDRLVMPPVMSIILATIFYFIFRFISGDNVWYLFAGFLAGYSTYLIIHYAIHRFRPPSNFLRYLWTHHTLHHYQADTAAFSVSFPLWDWLFNTMPKRGGRGDQGDVNHVPDTTT